MNYISVSLTNSAILFVYNAWSKQENGLEL